MIEQDPPTEQNADRYWCFISYRHADNLQQDRDWASWLHREIERYEVPAELVGTRNSHGDLVPERIYPVFRDEESLPADADLASSIIAALDSSRFLVALCSPRAVESQYVAQEIRHFKQSGKSDCVVAAILDGQPGDPEQECFPEPLRHPIDENGSIDTSVTEEPIAADFRLKEGSSVREGFTSAEAYRLNLADGDDLDKREREKRAEAYSSQLQLMKLKIIAGILGVPLEQLRDRDKAYQLELAKKRSRTLKRWLAAVAVLALLAVGGGVFSYLQSQEAQRQRNAALRESGLAFREQGRETFVNGSPIQALVYLQQALERIPNDKVTRFLINRALPSAPLSILKHRDQGIGNPRLKSVFSPDGTRVVTANTADQMIQVFDAVTGESLFSLEEPDISDSPLEGVRQPPSLAFSPNGTSLLVSRGDQFIAVYDPISGELQRVLQAHQGAINSIMFSADGTRMVSASADGTARVWSTQDWSLQSTLPGFLRVNAASLNSDGSMVLTQGWGDDENRSIAKVFEASSGRLLFTIMPDGREVHSAIFSPDGRRIAARLRESIELFDISDIGEGVTETSMALQSGAVVSMAFSPDGTRLLTASLDGIARVWDVEQSGELKTTLAANIGALTSAQFSPSGKTIVTAYSQARSARVWDAATGGQLAILGGHENQVLWAGFSDDGSRLLTATGIAARLYDASALQPLLTLDGFEAEVETIQFSANGARLLTTDTGPTARVFELATGAELALIDPRADWGVRSANFDPDGNRVVVTGNDESARVFEIATGNSISLSKGDDSGIMAAMFSPQGTRIVTANNDERARVVDASTGRLLSALEELTDRNTPPSFSPDGSALLAKNGLFDTSTGRRFATPAPVSTIYPDADEWSKNAISGVETQIDAATFSPDGSVVLMRGMHRLWIYNAALDEIIAVIEGHTRYPNDMFMGRRSVRSAQFSADGNRVVTAGQDRLARIWDASTGEQLITLSWHDEALDSSFFSPAGDLILTRSHGDGSARIFDSATGKPLHILADFNDGRFSNAIFSPDGSRAATASGQVVRIWDIAGYEGSAEDLGNIVRQRVPYRITVEGVVVPKSLVGSSNQ